MSCTLKGDTYSFIQVVTKFKCIPPKHGFNGLTVFQLKFNANFSYSMNAVELSNKWHFGNPMFWSVGEAYFFLVDVLATTSKL